MESTPKAFMLACTNILEIVTTIVCTETGSPNINMALKMLFLLMTSSFLGILSMASSFSFLVFTALAV